MSVSDLQQLSSNSMMLFFFANKEEIVCAIIVVSSSCDKSYSLTSSSLLSKTDSSLDPVEHSNLA
eukprot:13100640-Ditylum_brightwellii.AAC.1